MVSQSRYQSSGALPCPGRYGGWCRWRFFITQDRTVLALCYAGLGISNTGQQRRLGSLDEWNSFVNEHDGNIISNGIEIPPILTYQATVDGLCDWCPTAVGELPLTYTVVDTCQQGRFG